MDRPALTFSLADREIRWTYGLQQDLQRVMPDAGEGVVLVMTDPYIQDYFVRRALTDKQSFIKDENDLIAPAEIELDPDEVAQLLDWLTGHLLYFFASMAGKMTRRGVDLKASLAQFQQSTVGSES